ncbi:TRAP transporter small permease [Hydrogenophaga sp. OTU3427]|jgi:TRAP-type C4-dicarboxylate transport system permease small subunit|uniref:TRAP transporter small permease n=1 Tax=Hydrogenophaga sp. OTU3427 TaxID=3043856 RepID=UPI00313D2FCB
MKKLLDATESVAAFFLLAICALTATNVVVRNVMSVQVPDWYDGSRLLLGIAIFWGIAIATYRGGHICVDALWEYLGPRNRVRVDMLATTLTFAFLCPLAWMVWVKVGGTGEQATSDLLLPMKWFYTVSAVGATAAAILSTVRVIQMWRNSTALPEQEEAPHGA